MKISKGNLLVVELTRLDKQIPVIDHVHIRKDGCTVATNGMAVMCVSPVTEEMKEKIPLDEKKMFTDETVASETIKEILKNMPRDTKFKGVLEHCDYASGNFELTDGKRRRNISAKTWHRDYINYRDVLKNAHKRRNGQRCVVNLKRLLTILQTINKICPDSSKNSAVFLEFTEDDNIFIRSTNNATDQKILAYMKAYDKKEISWPELDEWEKDLLGEKKSRKIKKEKNISSLRDVNLTLKEKSKVTKKKFDKWKLNTKKRIRKEKAK